ncbi:MAG: 30S ribosomal protein S9 [Bullifex sp.]|nr:30S ribosomal protein S9 [Spirochaetales bacterium]MDY2816663.1 30S ribosomal protein S9 [Bullifex sp.]MDD7007832.1 30S ribosomal protein S9 [Spirochaetales bacterium]MDD7535720.1 30S ribosomal protein S9 [Spirochaetales bacterium]MDY3850259.1 30S ribosomal protein S9 [Bullifex sp.]
MAKKEKKEIVNLGHGVGRRKSAVARVYLREGNGTITVNGKNVDEYFVDALSVFTVKQPLVLTETADKFDVVITVSGGGINGQAGACRHGIARALCEEDNDAYRSALHAAGFMTRDPRMVERKKYGQRGARRRFQFSKR